MMDTPNLIIVDLGGVLYNIEFERTRTAFRALSGYNGRDIEFGVENQDRLFVMYDRGDVSTEDFRKGLRTLYGFTCSDEDIDKAWCAILNHGPFEFALDFVKRIKTAYVGTSNKKIVLLSNISELHYEYALPLCTHIFQAFDSLYYSFSIRLRKPDPACFMHVCSSHGVSPANAILFDDSLANCLSAGSLGISTVHVTNPLEIYNLLQSGKPLPR